MVVLRCKQLPFHLLCQYNEKINAKIPIAYKFMDVFYFSL